MSKFVSMIAALLLGMLLCAPAEAAKGSKAGKGRKATAALKYKPKTKKKPTKKLKKQIKKKKHDHKRHHKKRKKGGSDGNDDGDDADDADDADDSPSIEIPGVTPPGNDEDDGDDGDDEDDDSPAASPAAAVPASAVLEFTVPSNAEVWFSGTKTTQTGRVRKYTTPELPPGKDYHYNIRVRWRTADGQMKEIERLVPIHAGDRIEADFTQPAS